jgi:hypothetical protein
VRSGRHVALVAGVTWALAAGPAAAQGIAEACGPLTVDTRPGPFDPQLGDFVVTGAVVTAPGCDGSRFVVTLHDADDQVLATADGEVTDGSVAVDFTADAAVAVGDYHALRIATSRSAPGTEVLDREVTRDTPTARPDTEVLAEVRTREPSTRPVDVVRDALPRTGQDLLWLVVIGAVAVIGGDRLRRGPSDPLAARRRR